MFPRHAFYISIGAFFGGVLFRSFVDIGPHVPFFLAFLGCAMCFLSFRVGALGRRAIFGYVLLTFAFSLGVVRVDVHTLWEDTARFDAFVAQLVFIDGVVIDEPDERDTHTQLAVRIERIAGADTREHIVAASDTRVLVFTDYYPVYQYGDRLTLAGVLEEPDNFETDTGRIFPYKNFLRARGISYRMMQADIVRIGTGEGSAIKRYLFALKQSFVAALGAVLPEPHASLASGLIVGNEAALGNDLVADFRTVGLIHIVVLSGYNVSLVAEAVMRLFRRFLPNRASLVLGIVGIVLFTILTGASATIIRASIMAVLVMLARIIGRQYNMARALFAAGFVMVLHNPLILAFDPSFQLSFLATLSLIVLAPHIGAWLSRVPSVLQLRETLVATLSTQLFVLPYILYLTGALSLVAVPVNVLVLAVIPATMLFGFMSGALGMFVQFLALPFGWITYTLLSYELFIINLFARLPFAELHVGFVPFWVVVVLYGVIAAWLWHMMSRGQLKT